MRASVAANLNQVSRIYMSKDGQPFVALSKISLQVLAGEFLAFMGPSGSGKSTLLGILGCLDGQNSGEVEVFGERVLPHQFSKRAQIRRKNIGFVFQNYKLLPALTIVENVARPLVFRGVSPARRTQLAREQLDRVGLIALERRRPSQLSGGQQQRVAIARALAVSPQLLIADEPTGALDSENAALVINLLQDLNREGMTILMGTHDTEMSRHAHAVIGLKDGQIEYRREPAHASD